MQLCIFLHFFLSCVRIFWSVAQKVGESLFFLGLYFVLFSIFFKGKLNLKKLVKELVQFVKLLYFLFWMCEKSRIPWICWICYSSLIILLNMQINICAIYGWFYSDFTLHLKKESSFAIIVHGESMVFTEVFNFGQFWNYLELFYCIF